MVQWIKELVTLLLFSGIFLMIVPDTDLRPFLRLIVGLLMIAVIIQPLVGTGVLIRSSQIAARLEHSWRSVGVTRIESSGIEHLQVQAERLVQKGSDAVREQMENQTNRQLGALLGLFAGIDEAQVVTQVNAHGRLERVLVQVHLTKDVVESDEWGLSYTIDDYESKTLVPLVEPVSVTNHMPVAEPVNDSAPDPLVKRIQTWVAGFYGIDPECVMVVTI